MNIREVDAESEIAVRNEKRRARLKRRNPSRKIYFHFLSPGEFDNLDHLPENKKQQILRDAKQMVI
jgi:hypothetical protein